MPANLTTVVLFTAQTTNATSPSGVVQGGDQKNWHAGLFVATGGFGGGSLSFQVSADGGVTWAPCAPSITAPGVVSVQLPPAILFQAVLTGATAATLNARWVE
jgi:hypothetical protein